MTVRVMSPPLVRSASRSDRTESLIPTIARDRSRKPEGPLLRWPSTTAFQRLPRNVNALANVSARGMHCLVVTDWRLVAETIPANIVSEKSL